jgi:hypothetical protein
MADEEEERDRAIRLPVAMLDRGTALIPRLAKTQWGDAVKWTTTAVARVALSRGLVALEAELAELENPESSTKKKRGGT